MWLGPIPPAQCPLHSPPSITCTHRKLPPGALSWPGFFMNLPEHAYFILAAVGACVAWTLCSNPLPEGGEMVLQFRALAALSECFIQFPARGEANTLFWPLSALHPHVQAYTYIKINLKFFFLLGHGFSCPCIQHLLLFSVCLFLCSVED